MPEFQEELRTHLLGVPELARRLGPRLFSSAVPTDARLPFVQYTVTNVDPVLSFDGEIGAATGRVLYTVAAKTEAEAERIIHLIRRRLNGLRTVQLGSVYFQHVIMQGGFYEVEFPPDAGEQFPDHGKAAEFEVLYHLRAADPQPQQIVFDPPPPPPAGGGGDPGGGGGDPGGGGGDPGGGGGGGELPAWPAFVPSPEMTEHYGQTSFDVGVLGNQTFQTAAVHWHGGHYINWLQWQGTSPPLVTDPVEGLPNGRSNYNGTLGRIQDVRPGAGIGCYVTILRAGDAATCADEHIWPRARALITSDYDPSWFNPGYNTPPDLRPGEKGLAYSIAACRDVHSREFARLLSVIKTAHPLISRVYSDNWCLRDICTTVDWTGLMNLLTLINDRQRNEFGVAVPLFLNATSHYKGDLRADLDDLAAAGVGGLSHEGFLAQHIVPAVQFDNIVRNVKHWIAKDWIGGGKRYLASVSGSEDQQFSRRLAITDHSLSGNVATLTLAGPHYLTDTSIWRLRIAGLNPDPVIDGRDVRCAPHVSDPTKLTINYTQMGLTAPLGGYAVGPDSTCTIIHSKRDIDAGWLHSLRTPESYVWAPWVNGIQDSRGNPAPLWKTWAANFGYAIGEPEVVSTHHVTGASPTLQVKEIRTPFAGGWYLHLDLSLPVRRAWWHNGS